MVQPPHEKIAFYLKKSSTAAIFALVVTVIAVLIMPSSDPAANAPSTGKTSDDAAKAGKHAEDTMQAAKSSAAVASAAPPKLSGAELKAQKKAEKAARRQQDIQARQVGSRVPSTAGQTGPSTSLMTGSNLQGVQVAAKGAKIESAAGHHKRSGSMLSLSSKATHSSMSVMSGTDLPMVEDKTVELFRHLYKARASTIADAAKEVHPAVLALGQQMSSYTVCGSIARLVATLQAFKRVSLWHRFYLCFSVSRHAFACQPFSVNLCSLTTMLHVSIPRYILLGILKSDLL